MISPLDLLLLIIYMLMVAISLILAAISIIFLNQK